MTSVFSLRVARIVALALLTGTPVISGAQTCRGMPHGGGIAFTYGSVYLGSTMGVAASKGVLSLGFNSLSSDADVSAWDANVRFTVPMGGRLQVCPSLGLEYMNQVVTLASNDEITARHASAAGGIGLGYTLDVAQGISVSPFVGADFKFNGIVYSMDTETDEDELSGDTLSFLNLQYGGVVQYKSFYAGFAADRSTHESGGLYRTRLFLGFAFGGGSKSSRSAPVPQPRTDRAPARKN